MKLPAGGNNDLAASVVTVPCRPTVIAGDTITIHWEALNTQCSFQARLFFALRQSHYITIQSGPSSWRQDQQASASYRHQFGGLTAVIIDSIGKIQRRSTRSATPRLLCKSPNILRAKCSKVRITGVGWHQLGRCRGRVTVPEAYVGYGAPIVARTDAIAQCVVPVARRASIKKRYRAAGSRDPI